MKRDTVLEKLGFSVPKIKKKRVIIHSDIAAEADDPFAIVHHLLTPSEDIRGIIAANFEWKFRNIPSMKLFAGHSADKSLKEGKKILTAMDIDDVPLVKGAANYLTDVNKLPDSPGADLIIQEAMRKTEAPLYIALQAHLTDLAIAYLKQPEIAKRIAAAVWIGGGVYPMGGEEPNLREDVLAAQIVFDSPIPIWQIPHNVYSGCYLSFAELMRNVKPMGKIGAYLAEEMVALNDWYGKIPMRMPFPHGETWSIGDQPTVSVLLETEAGSCWHEQRVQINDDMSYRFSEDYKPVKVYDNIDRRLMMDDFFAKLAICYGE